VTKTFAALLKKELFAFSIQGAVYATAVVFSAACALRFFFATHFFVVGQGSADLRLFFSFIPYISILAVPALTMSLWSGEHARCDEFLPVSDGALIAAKWLAALLVYVLMLLPGVSVPVAVSLFGDIDGGQAAASYLGIVCFAALSIAAGEFFSILTANRIAAFLCTALLLAVSNSIHLLPLYVPLPSFLTSLLNQLSFAWHFDAAGKGIIDSRDLVFYAVMTALCLYGSQIALDRRRNG
jgi:hypothetical protein